MRFITPAFALALSAGTAFCAVQWYGDQDVLGTNNYPVDPTEGATVEGLGAGAITFGAPAMNHGWGFDPEPDDFPGTDQIYVGSSQTGFHDGYSMYAGRLAGPQVLTMDYAALIPAGHSVQTLTLGVGADDFQQVPFGQPYSVLINGMEAPELDILLNGLDQTGPRVQYFSIGLDVAFLQPNHVLQLSIDQGGDGGDGWAVDFLSIGVTSSYDPVFADEWPGHFQLEQNAPNPFNPVTHIAFSLAETQQVQLRVFNVLGKEVALLAHGLMSAGDHSVLFDAQALPGGLYFYSLEAGGKQDVRKMVLMK